MMKKLIVLFIILGMVSVANAGMIDLWITSLDGQAIDPVKEITILPSQEVDLTMVFVGVDQNLYSLSEDLVLSGPGEFVALDGIKLDDNYSDAFFNEIFPSAGNIGFSLVAGLNDGAGDGADVAWDIIVHCLDAGTVTFDLVANSTYPAGVTIVNPQMELFVEFSGATINQIPEPMTIGLLGLGGLFALRRRKK